jgi:hypothetical protein
VTGSGFSPCGTIRSLMVTTSTEPLQAWITWTSLQSNWKRPGKQETFLRLQANQNWPTACRNWSETFAPEPSLSS